MLDVIWSVAAFVVAIGVLISFHEFGHFWVARRLGVKVLRYSVGFGKPLWRRVGADGVEYVIAALPLGGYVKMLDEREGDVPPADAPRAFNRQAPWRRIAIVSAGPAANFLMAFVAYWIVYVAGIAGLKPIIDAPAPNTLAAAAGLQEGDTIIALNGEPVPTFQVLRTELIELALASEQVLLDVQPRLGPARKQWLPLAGARVDPEYLFEDLGINPVQPVIPPVLSEVVPGESAAAAGFQAGDRLLAYRGAGGAGDVLRSWQQWATYLRAHPGDVVEVDVQRGDQQQSLTVIIGREQRDDGTALGRFGARVDVPDGLWDNLTTEHRLSFWAAAPAAAAQTARMSALTLKMMYRMVLGDVSVKNVTGPIQIAQFAGYTASIGLVSFLSFIAIMSVSLAVLNLLPVPVLDGGHLLYYTVEMVKGSPLSERAQVVGQQVGLTLLVALMGLAFYNDILRLIN
ncbi:MAG TPA: RIP metalloprotease RseP [Verrucomicrobiae bacterium]|nr:RIP metalloprotease RseP [Verrucomicrobiae bacterium]